MNPKVTFTWFLELHSLYKVAVVSMKRMKVWSSNKTQHTLIHKSNSNQKKY